MYVCELTLQTIICYHFLVDFEIARKNGPNLRARSLGQRNLGIQKRMIINAMKIHIGYTNYIPYMKEK